MKHQAEQIALPLAVEGVTEQQSIECHCQELPDALYRLESQGWMITTIDRLPANCGYRLSCQRTTNQGGAE